MSKFYCGIDVGNYDTKSSNTTTPSGYQVSDVLPPETEEYILYNGKYYVPCQERFPYRMNKTLDERALILTLFGISKEMIFSAKAEGKEDIKLIEEYIGQHSDIVLGVGLPPAHFSTLKDTTEKYYKEHMGNWIKYKFGKYNFNIRLVNISILPQDYAAVMANTSSFELIQKYQDGIVYAIDMGGMTIDYVPIVKGTPEMTSADSIELGANKMYDSIIRDVNINTGHMISPTNIEQVLLDKETVVPAAGKEIIINSANKWVDKIIDKLREKGMDLWANPAVFLGGYALLMKNALNSNELVKNSIFIDSANANAKAYTAIVLSQY